MTTAKQIFYLLFSQPSERHKVIAKEMPEHTNFGKSMLANMCSFIFEETLLLPWMFATTNKIAKEGSLAIFYHQSLCIQGPANKVIVISKHSIKSCFKLTESHAPGTRVPDWTQNLHSASMFDCFR